MSRTRDPLLGRDGEIHLLQQVLLEASDGDAGFVLVTGEAGIGKTRLLEELVDIATAHGCLTLMGRAAEFDTELPFGLFTDAFDAYLASLDTQALDRLAVDRLGALATVFPSLREIDDAVEYPASATERYRVHRAVRELMERLAARRPLVLVLDDLHWADGASLELVAHLLRHAPQGEVMLAMAMRAGHGGPESPDVLAAIQRPGLLQRIDLGPLDVESMIGLVPEDGSMDADHLHYLSGGNPFYALQLARSVVSTPTTAPEARLEVPAAVASAIAFELARLSESARGLLEAAAVIGDPFDIDLAAVTSGRLVDDALDDLDELVRRDLVIETEVPRRFQFRHPIVRSAVYGSCTPSRRMALHRRAVEELTARGAPAIALAGHVEQSAVFGDLTAVETLRRAAEDSARQAPTSAVGWLDAALRILPADADPVVRAALLMSLAGSQAALGRFEDSHDSLVESLALGSTSDAGRAELTVRCAEMEQLLGHHSESRSRLELALEELEERDSTSAVSLLIALASASLYLSDHEGMLTWGKRAVEASELLGDAGPLLAAALAAHTMGAAFAGQIELGLQLHHRCSRLVDSLPDEIISERLDSLSNLATAETYLDRHVLGCSHGERALALARVTGQTHLLPILTPILGSSLAMAGEMKRSAEVLEDAIDAARLVGDAQGLAMNLFNRALSAQMAGDLDTAMRTGAESIGLAGSIDNGVITAFAGAIHAQTLLESGDAHAATELLLASVGGDEIPLLAGGWRAHFFEVLTRCHLAQGQRSEAAVAAERVRREADQRGLGLTRLMADRAGALVSLEEGQPERAKELARSAVAVAGEIGAKAHVPPARALLGRAMVAAGQRDDGVEQLERAAAEFDELGAVVYRDRLDSELRRLGHAIHRRSSRGKTDGSGLEALTGREREVAELVSDRRTNREIAAELFLSTKTVETHMRNIFNKLGVSSRVEVARMTEGSHHVQAPSGV